MITLKSITHLGDAGLILPLAAMVLIWLAWRRHAAAAMWWAAAALTCFCSIAALKIVLIACSKEALLRSPSGHAANAALVYGAIAVIAGAALSGAARFVVLAAAAAAILAVALTRVMLGAHTWAEVVLGLVVGGAALAGFAWPYLRRIAVEPKPWLLVGLAAVIIVAMQGQQIYIEDLMQMLGLRLRGAVPACA